MKIVKSAADFAEVYNNIDAFPTLLDVASELGVSYSTVKNIAGTLRFKRSSGQDVPPLIARNLIVRAKKAEELKLSPVDHAKARASALSDSILKLVQKTMYPVINPEAIIVESHVSEIYDRITGSRREREGTPRTWLGDTLKVASVKKSKGRKFVFTGAQNDAVIHEGFWENLKTYAKLIGAEIVVGPWTYETQWWSETNPLSRAYHSEISNYMCFGQMKIGENFVFCGEMNTLPTANRPISDLTTYSRGRWAVFPHARLQLKSVPSTDPHVQAHQVMTTGSVTRPKVIPRKAGIKSIFHQIIGATIVEFDKDGDVFCRQINADDDGSFYDLNYFVSGGAVTDDNRIDALISGDIHLRKAKPENFLGTFGFDPKSTDTADGSIVETLMPAEILLHDLHDNEERNHHNVGDNAHNYEMAFRNRGGVLGEVKDGAAFLARLRHIFAQITVIDSNHDLALERYIREGRYRNDGINIRMGLRMEDAYLEWREQVAIDLDANKTPPSFSLLEWAMRDIAKSELDDVRWVHDGYSHVINGIECGNHGFRGSNGAKGTVAGFAQLGRKMNIADKHSPEIMDGVYVAGCMNLRQGYNKGPSGWAIAHIVQYQNGKRTIITMQKGKWRG
ncbi:MAG: hypothetical protein ACEQSB_00385 [Undibacterium sp.]